MLYHNVAVTFLALMVTSAIAAPTLRISADDLAARELGVREPSTGQFPDENVVPVESTEPAKLARRAVCNGKGTPPTEKTAKGPPGKGGPPAKGPPGKKGPNTK